MWLENTVGKGDFARYEQFLLFPHCFQKCYTADTLKPQLVWERVNAFAKSIYPYHPVDIDQNRFLSFNSFNLYQNDKIWILPN